MKKVIILIISFFVFICKINAQPYLIEQGNNQSIIINNVSIKKNEIISKDAFGIFSGYEIKEDSLICFFNKRGKLTSKTYYIGSKYSLSEMPKKLNPDYDSCHWKTKFHYFKDYKLILGKGAVLCKNGKIIWSVSNEYPNCNDVDTSNYYSLSGYITPQISQDESSILFEVRRTAIWTPSNWIVEIDFKTGIERKIAKGKNPCYSPDGKYILFKDDIYDYYYLYDKTTLKQERVGEGGIVYWLYK